MLENRANLSSDNFEALSQAVSDHSSIKHAVDWSASRKPPLAFLDSIAQDEFSHDILIEYSSGLYLVYDVT